MPFPKHKKWRKIFSMIVLANLTKCFCICAPIPSIFKKCRVAKRSKKQGSIARLPPCFRRPYSVQYLYRKKYFQIDFFATYISSWLASSIEVNRIIFSFRRDADSRSDLRLGFGTRFEIVMSPHPWFKDSFDVE